jgi:hypothetical protein
MKRLILTFLIIAGTSQIFFGQIVKSYSKGNIVSSGSFSANFVKDEFVSSGNQIITYYTKNNVFESDIYIGYFLLNQFTIGFSSDINFAKQIYTNSLNPVESTESSTNNVLIGPFLRYYSKTGLFCEGSTSFGFLNYDPNHQDSYTKYLLKAAIGYDLMLSESVAIEPMVNYRFLKYHGEQALGHKTKDKGLSISIGFSIYLDTKTNK